MQLNTSTVSVKWREKKKNQYDVKSSSIFNTSLIQSCLFFHPVQETKILNGLMTSFQKQGRGKSFCGRSRVMRFRLHLSRRRIGWRCRRDGRLRYTLLLICTARLGERLRVEQLAFRFQSYGVVMLKIYMCAIQAILTADIFSTHNIIIAEVSKYQQQRWRVSYLYSSLLQFSQVLQRTSVTCSPL